MIRLFTLVWCCVIVFMKNHFIMATNSYAVQTNFRRGGGTAPGYVNPESKEYLKQTYNIKLIL